MAKKRTYETEKVDADFRKEMRELAKMRYFKGLEKKEPSFPEITRLAMKTESWKGVKNELQMKPRKEDLKRYGY